MDLTEPLDRLWNFNEQRVYLLLAIARSKENESVQATDQPTMRKVVEDRGELADKVEQLSHAQSRFDNDYRLYATVNGRNAVEAMHFLQKELLDSQEEARKSGEVPRMAKRVDHEWKSIIHQPRCRDEKRFLWDIDDASPEARSSISAALQPHTTVVLEQETPNGWHIITEPFNFHEVEGYDEEAGIFAGWECERKNDDMIFLGFLSPGEG